MTLITGFYGVIYGYVFVPDELDDASVVDRRGRGVLKGQVLISERLAEVTTRQSIGHWEGDLVVGNKITAVAPSFGSFTPELWRTLTWDQGKEIAGHRDLTKGTGIKVYLCNPKLPWQRGTDENTNGLLRQYFPKGQPTSMPSNRESSTG